MSGSRKRGRAGARRFDPTDFQKLFEDRRMWCVLARVALHDGEVDHFEFITDENGQREVLVDVVSIPGEIELRCRLPGAGGIWRIPALGTEVYVGLPDGMIDWVPGILAVIGDPGSTSGLAANVAVVELAPAGVLLVHDGDSGEAVKLPTWADFNALREYVAHQFDPTNGHIHAVAGAATTTQTTGAGPYTVPAPDPVPTPAGTETIKVK